MSTIVRMSFCFAFLIMSLIRETSTPGNRFKNSIGKNLLKSSSSSLNASPSTLPVFAIFSKSGSYLFIFLNCTKISAVCAGLFDQIILSFFMCIVNKVILLIIAAGLISPPYDGPTALVPRLPPVSVY